MRIHVRHLLMLLQMAHMDAHRNIIKDDVVDVKILVLEPSA